ncbi:MAG: hypothetical protein QME57_04495 [Patescibacteria group bacterium]|nr:hypothetical protein [Patescibacteria group bacterium]
MNKNAPFGLRAEKWVVEMLVAAGYQVIPATEVEDKVHKVDFWVAWQDSWLPIQFSVDRQAMVSWKGFDALRRGIVPSWLDGQELEQAVNGRPELQPRLVEQFWRQVEAVVAKYPECKLRAPVATALTGR